MQAVSAGALIGPAQVLARIVEASFLNRYHPLVSTRLACLMHPVGAIVLALAGGGASQVLFAIFHGAGNGILTIARGTLPLAIFGSQNYGYRLGIIGAPARMAQAIAPLAFGLLIDTMGSRILIVSSGTSLAALFVEGGATFASGVSSDGIRSICPFPSRPTSRKSSAWKTRPVRRLLSGVLWRWAITPPQSYAVSSGRAFSGGWRGRSISGR